MDNQQNKELTEALEAMKADEAKDGHEGSLDKGKSEALKNFFISIGFLLFFVILFVFSLGYVEKHRSGFIIPSAAEGNGFLGALLSAIFIVPLTPISIYLYIKYRRYKKIIEKQD